MTKWERRQRRESQQKYRKLGPSQATILENTQVVLCVAYGLLSESDGAKLEIDHMRVAGAGRGTDFIPAIPAPAESQQRESGGRTATGMKIVNGNVTTHVMR